VQTHPCLVLVEAVPAANSTIIYVLTDASRILHDKSESCPPLFITPRSGCSCCLPLVQTEPTTPQHYVHALPEFPPFESAAFFNGETRRSIVFVASEMRATSNGYSTLIHLQSLSSTLIHASVHLLVRSCSSIAARSLRIHVLALCCIELRCSGTWCDVCHVPIVRTGKEDPPTTEMGEASRCSDVPCFHDSKDSPRPPRSEHFRNPKRGQDLT